MKYLRPSNAVALDYFSSWPELVALSCTFPYSSFCYSFSSNKCCFKALKIRWTVDSSSSDLLHPIASSWCNLAEWSAVLPGRWGCDCPWPIASSALASRSACGASCCRSCCSGTSRVRGSCTSRFVCDGWKARLGHWPDCPDCEASQPRLLLPR